MHYLSAAPYTQSASIYDTLMADIDYAGWCDYILDLAEEFHFATRSVYDISCGTGTFLHLFPATKKYGLDISAPMIAKAKKTHPELRLAAGNMLRPPLKDVDLYLNLHDALNYVSSFSAVKAHLSYMDKNLKRGQLYIFDFALPSVMKNYFLQDAMEDTNPEGISFRRENSYDEKRRRAITDLYIYFPDGRAYHERHVEYIYDYREIIKLSVEFPRRTFIFLEEFSFQEAHEASNRIIVIMR
ncbi:MAG: class I SAM-dependent methyltransferase [Candidatus Marinimicrobia bacterium]|nr:class I SAM-dependent methyltransferase [Candidatus Neomarinimicrobiota bacterium]